jgi:hypothetical protein
MRMWLDFSLRLASAAGTRLIGSTNSVIDALQHARLEQSRTSYQTGSPHGGVLWRNASPMEDYGTDWVPHRVIRRTPQSVLVEAHPAVTPGDADSRAPTRTGRTYWLNRRDLERLGVARVRSRSIVFFTRPNASEESVKTLKSLIRLGVWFPFTEKDLRQAYLHRAAKHHPDAGGTDEKFIQLQDDHERAKIVLDLPINASHT